MTEFPTTDDWHGLYGAHWKNVITDEAHRHPAKFSRNLIEHIYKWLIDNDNDYLKAGDTVLDPFGGVALGACGALRYGLSWQGVELEQKFVDLGAGCDCTGISKQEWVRFYGRWEQANYKDGRHWCPQCLSEAGMVSKPALQLGLFPEKEAKEAIYIRNSGKIPFTLPHRYNGNIWRFQKYAKGGAAAVLLQGDSRRLLTVLEGVFNAAITSPPFAGNSGGRGEASRNGIDAGLFDRHQGAMVGGIGDKESGNLGSLQAKDGDFEAVITSPPYADGCTHKGGDDPKPKHVKGGSIKGVGLDGSFSIVSYGSEDGQLASLPRGDIDAVITSPPYVESLASDEPEKRGGLFRDPRRKTDKTLTATYGASPGQVGAMDAGSFEEVVTSPPYEASLSSKDHGIDFTRAKKDYPGRVIHGENSDNLGQTGGDTFWSAARLILEQSYQALTPGGVAVFVTKDFVKAGQRVPFSDNWSQLCAAVGFIPEARFRAWLVEEKGSQYNLNGGLETKTIERKSFFRRLAEIKGSPRIDWEDVLVFRKV